MLFQLPMLKIWFSYNNKIIASLLKIYIKIYIILYLSYITLLLMFLIMMISSVSQKITSYTIDLNEQTYVIDYVMKKI